MGPDEKAMHHSGHLRTSGHQCEEPRENENGHIRAPYCRSTEDLSNLNLRGSAHCCRRNRIDNGLTGDKHEEDPWCEESRENCLRFTKESTDWIYEGVEVGSCHETELTIVQMNLRNLIY